jgi:hypothetical protein
MSTKILQLNKIVNGQYGTLLDTNEGIYVVNQESILTDMTPNAVSDNNINKWNTVDITNGITYANTYPISSFLLQSYQFKYGPIQRTNTKADYVDTFAPQINYNDLCQYRDYAFILSDITLAGPKSKIVEDTMDPFDLPVPVLKELDIKTYVYPSSSIISLDALSGDNTMVPLYNLSGIPFNYFCEIPLSYKYFNYELASQDDYFSVYADVFNCKNSYDFNYGVRSVLTSAGDATTISGYIDYCRDYTKVDCTGDLLYLVYNTNKFYETSAAQSISGTGITFNMTPTSSFFISGDIANINMTPALVLSAKPNYSSISGNIYDLYECVEVLNNVNSINRIRSQLNHKANLFSINIQNANIINNDSLTEEEKTNIQTSIKNIIKNIYKQFVPANTQLFNIYFNGD